MNSNTTNRQKFDHDKRLQENEKIIEAHKEMIIIMKQCK